MNSEKLALLKNFRDYLFITGKKELETADAITQILKENETLSEYRDYVLSMLERQNTQEKPELEVEELDSGNFGTWRVINGELVKVLDGQ